MGVGGGEGGQKKEEEELRFRQIVAPISYLYRQTTMNHKEDFFRSPIARNLEYFCSPLLRIRNDDELFLDRNLFTPFNQQPRSPGSVFEPIPEEGYKNNQPIISQKLVPRQIAERINFEESSMSEQLMRTPEKVAVKAISSLETTGRKKYDLRFSEALDKQNFGKDSERGLRALSRQAYDILGKYDAMTYQEVAAKIIEENDQIGDYSDRERQSIKRRVYDALNVLIAVEVLEKNDKKISINDKKHSEHQRQNFEKHSIEKRLSERQASARRKKQVLHSLKAMYGNLRKLIQRNLSREGVYPKNKRVSFPFIIASKQGNPSNQDALVKINSAQGKQMGLFIGSDLTAISQLVFSPSQN